MNLFYMLSRRDKNLTAQGAAQLAKDSVPGFGDWNCIKVEADAKPQLTVHKAAQWYPFTERPNMIGWYARTLSGEAKLVTTFVNGAVSEVSIDESPVPVAIPWPLSGTPIADDAPLSLHFQLEPGQEAELMVSKVLNRSPLVSLAKGKGVEIGPGPRPQILNGPDVDVRYVEEMPQEKWLELYDQNGRFKTAEADWSRYVIGTANALPVEDDSLDFIFSSHVFEHLANPLGHLQHWSKKLKSGGLVLAVVPDIVAKDYMHSPSSLEELRLEYKRGIWEPQASHYSRWGKQRRFTPERIEAMMKEKASIHVHFYTRENMSRLLRYATEILPYKGFHIQYSSNAKDFYFVLVKK